MCHLEAGKCRAQEHLILVTELLRANLYEFQRYIRDAGEPVYFTLPHVQRIASQVLASCTRLTLE